MNLVTFTGVNFTIANSNFFVYIVGLLATKTFTYIIVLVIRKGNHKSFQSTKSMKFAQVLILSCVTLAISMIFCHYILFYNTSFVLNILSIISLFFLIVSNVMIFNIIDAQYELISIKEKL